MTKFGIIFIAPTTEARKFTTAHEYIAQQSFEQNPAVAMPSDMQVQFEYIWNILKFFFFSTNVLYNVYFIR